MEIKGILRKLKVLEKVEDLLISAGYGELSLQIRNEIIKLNKEIYEIENKEN